MLFVIGAIIFFSAASTFGGNTALPSLSQDAIPYMNLSGNAVISPTPEGVVSDLVVPQVQGTSDEIDTEPTLPPPVPCDPSTISYDAPAVNSLQLGFFACPTAPPSLPTATPTPSPAVFFEVPPQVSPDTAL